MLLFWLRRFVDFIREKVKFLTLTTDFWRMYLNLQQQNNNRKQKTNQVGLKVDKDSKNIAAKNLVINFTSLIKTSSIENKKHP